ncbi:MAG: hypothetical protein AAFY64_01365, partial [Pseudomonadota bacterium]
PYTTSSDLFRAFGGHDDHVRSVADVLRAGGAYGDDVRAIAPPDGHTLLDRFASDAGADKSDAPSEVKRHLASA